METPNYSIPQYGAGDAPDLGDQYNSAMEIIDLNMKEIEDTAAEGLADAATAQQTADTAQRLSNTNNINIVQLANRIENLEWDVRPISIGGTSGSTPLEAANKLMVPSLGVGTQITANLNLNEYVDVGSFVCPYTSSIPYLENKPSDLTEAFKMYVLDSGSYPGQPINDRIQIIITFQRCKVWMRSGKNGTWNPWVQCAQELDTGWIQPVSGYGGIRYRVKNGVLFINLSANMTLAAEETNLFTLPANYRPNIDVFSIVIYGGNLAVLMIHPNGNVNINPSVGQTAARWLYGSLATPITA